MKKTFTISIVVLAILMLSSLTLAANSHSNLLFNRIVILDDEQPVVVSITIENDRSTDFRNGKIVAIIPALDLRASRSLNVGATERQRTRLIFDTYEAIAPGDYWVRFTVSNEDVKRVRHRIITIE